MWGDVSCDKCNKGVDDFDYRWNGGLCNHCKMRRNIAIILPFIILGLIISIPFSLVEYNYEITKCSNLNSDVSNYDFDIKLETNAQYNSRCYYLTHHPLAIPSYILYAIIAGAFYGGALGFFIILLVKRRSLK